MEGIDNPTPLHALPLPPTSPHPTLCLASVLMGLCCVCRSGRTGRAGKTGVCVTLVGRNKEGLIPFIEKKAGVKFERTGAPQPADMAKVAGTPTLRSK